MAKYYPAILFALALGILYATTLQSGNLVGTDIHNEFYLAWRTLTQGFNKDVPTLYQTALSISLLPALISQFTHIDLLWVLKAIYPIFLALSVVVLYYLLKREFGTKTAFLSCLFYLAIPTYIVELPGIAKQQFTQLFLVLALLSFCAGGKWLWLVPVCMLITALGHYSLFVICVGYILGGLALILVLPRLMSRWRMPEVRYRHYALLLLPVALSLVLAGWFYANAGGGKVQSALVTMVHYANESAKIAATDLPGMDTEIISAEIISSVSVSDLTDPQPENVAIQRYAGYFSQQEGTVRYAIGLDFGYASKWGKAFLVFQYLTQICVIIGLVVIFRRWRHYSWPYLCLLIMACCLLAATVLYPGFSRIMNATRFYHMALLLMAPAFVIGCKAIFRREYVLAFVLVPYLFFTSGMAYEMAKLTPETGVGVPYSHALSAKRADTIGWFTPNDVAARDWILDNIECRPVYADLHAVMLLQQKIDWRYGPMFMPENVSIPDIACVFLRERNVEHRTLMYWGGVGMRVERAWDDSLSRMLEGRQILYQSGNAVVYGGRFDN